MASSIRLKLVFSVSFIFILFDSTKLEMTMLCNNPKLAEF
jgi:hypothetical protein